jgi:hypothetical protein
MLEAMVSPDGRGGMTNAALVFLDMAEYRPTHFSIQGKIEGRYIGGSRLDAARYDIRALPTPATFLPIPIYFFF